MSFQELFVLIVFKLYLFDLKRQVDNSFNLCHNNFADNLYLSTCIASFIVYFRANR